MRSNLNRHKARLVDSASLRLFFAAFPSPPVRDALVALREHLPAGSARLVAPEYLHLTLLFLGNVSLQDYRLLNERVQALQCDPFNINLRQMGSFADHSGYIAPVETPLPLQVLVQHLTDIAHGCSLSIEACDYLPHVTLARKLPAPIMPAEVTDLNWRVSEFHLVQSATNASGAAYTKLHSWPLVS